MTISGVIIAVSEDPAGTARFLAVIAILLAIGVLAAPCLIVAVIGLAEAVAAMI